MTTDLPQVINTYQNHTLDSRRWQGYQPRPDDIIIATSYKSGTTWTQEIVRQLIFLGQDTPERDATGLWQISPWLDHRATPLDTVLQALEAQPHRRAVVARLARGDGREGHQGPAYVCNRARGRRAAAHRRPRASVGARGHR